MHYIVSCLCFFLIQKFSWLFSVVTIPACLKFLLTVKKNLSSHTQQENKTGQGKFSEKENLLIVYNYMSK